MKDMQKISESEWHVLQIFWQKSPATANEAVDQLADKKSWNHRTVRTLINRLVQKKVLGFEQKGRQYYYYPLFDQAECVRAEARSFMSRIAGAKAGVLKPMLAAFLEDQQLSGQQERPGGDSQ